MEAVDTPELVKRAVHDDEAFRELQERFASVVWGSTYGYHFDRHTRDDLCQIVWLTLYQHLTRIREPERLAGWLAITTRRECVRLARARSRVELVGWFDNEPAAGGAEVDYALIRDETVRMVALAVSELDAPCRSLLRMLSTDPPLSYDEVAQALNMSVGSVGPSRQRCLDKLARRPAIIAIRDRSAETDTARST